MYVQMWVHDEFQSVSVFEFTTNLSASVSFRPKGLPKSGATDVSALIRGKNRPLNISVSGAARLSSYSHGLDGALVQYARSAAHRESARGQYLNSLILLVQRPQIITLRLRIHQMQ